MSKTYVIHKFDFHLLQGCGNRHHHGRTYSLQVVFEHTFFALAMYLTRAAERMCGSGEICAQEKSTQLFTSHLCNNAHVNKLMYASGPAAGLLFMGALGD